MTEENTKQKLEEGFKTAAQPLVDLLSNSDAMHLFLSRRKDNNVWTNEWDVAVVPISHAGTPVVTEPTVEEVKVKKTRSKKAS